MLAKDALDDHPQARPDVFAHGPVDGHVRAHGRHEFAGDTAGRSIAENLDGSVVGLERSVEGKLVLA